LGYQAAGLASQYGRLWLSIALLGRCQFGEKFFGNKTLQERIRFLPLHSCLRIWSWDYFPGCLPLVFRLADRVAAVVAEPGPWLQEGPAVSAGLFQGSAAVETETRPARIFILAVWAVHSFTRDLYWL
jgi:hypothetical protein